MDCSTAFLSYNITTQTYFVRVQDQRNIRCIDNQWDPNMSSGWGFTDKIGTVFCYITAGLSNS